MFSFVKYFLPFRQHIPDAPPIPPYPLIKIVPETYNAIETEIKNVKLRPVSERPYLGRNKPEFHTNSRCISDIHLREILIAKLSLKTAKIRVQQKRVFEHRHPVLRELLLKVSRK